MGGGCGPAAPGFTQLLERSAPDDLVAMFQTFQENGNVVLFAVLN